MNYLFIFRVAGKGMGKTIITYLIDGNPKGAQYATINNRTCKMLVIPRVSLSIVNEREELNSPAFYILLGEDDKLQPKAYLGETESFRERVKDHDYKKSFWEKALIFISKDGAMTKSDVQYLEHLAFAVAVNSGNYVLDENKQTPKAPNLPEHQKDTMDDFFEDIKFLTSFVGCNIFNIVEQTNIHLFFANNRGCNAKGFYNESGFTVLKGSEFSADVTTSFSAPEKREQFLNNHTHKEGNHILLKKDYTFSSPSTAAMFLIGRSTNGWTAWKDEKGKTLDEVYRQQLQ